MMLNVKGMSVKGYESEGMKIDVEVDDSKEGTAVGDECGDGTGIGKAWASTMKLLLIRYCRSIN